jgi:predicted metal-dependent hydrolase
MEQANNYILIESENSELLVKVRKSKKARSVRVFIECDASATLVVPVRMSMNRAEKFLQLNKNWVINKIAEQKATVVGRQVDGHIPIWGEQSKIEFSEGHKEIAIEEKKLLIGEALRGKENLGERIYVFLKDVLREEITHLAAHHCNLIHKNFSKISIKDTKTTWGSCSSKGNISFCWRLVFAPKQVVEYVVAHEVCHLLEMNHSRKFWSAVENNYPGYEKHRKWLKKHTSYLHSISLRR